MQLIYSNTNKIKFTDIAEKYAIPKKYKAKQCELHSALIVYVANNFADTKKFKTKVVDAINILTYCLLENEVPPFDWKIDDPLESMPDFDETAVRKVLGELYLEPNAIEWDVSVKTSTTSPITSTIMNTQAATNTSAVRSSLISSRATQKTLADTKRSPIQETPKEDLYIQSPKYPSFDYDKPWLSVVDRDDHLVIYRTLPEIPTKQNEISATTDVTRMTETELIRLFPNQMIRTRAASMYEEYEGMITDPVLGVIFPISGFTFDQIKDNIIRYPHLFKLKRFISEENITNFYDDIEISGELHRLSDIWNTLPESSVIPKTSDFLKEYAVRRYLLERDNGVTHRYKMYGSLDPFLTLFMPISDYIRFGYTNTTALAEQCVRSRINFKQTRNPILRRLTLR